MEFRSSAEFSPKNINKLIIKISSIFWLHFIQKQLQLTTIAAVQTTLDPEGERGKAGVGRKWGDYKHGHHRPSAATIQLAECKVPGSAAIINSVLWEALRPDRHPVPIAKKLIGQSGDHADKLIRMALKPLPDTCKRASVHRLAIKLVKRATLTSLAVLTICFRLAIRFETDNWLAIVLYSMIMKCLEVQSVIFLRLNVADLIVRYYYVAFFDSQSWVKFSKFDPFEFVSNAELLSHYLDREQLKRGRVFTDRQVVIESYELLFGKKRGMLL